MQTNCTVIAKVTVNKKLETYRIVFSFDKHNKITVRNAALVTGDICGIENPNAQLYIEQAIKQGMQDLRCANVQIVD
jgi:hypothetical protein